MNILRSIPSPEISYLDLGPVRVHFYALFILLGIVIALFLANKRLSQRGAESGVAIDIALWAVPFGIIGGRLFHVATHLNDYVYEGANLMRIFYVWEGGLAIYGALLLGVVGAWLGARSAGVRFWSFADAVAPGVLIAQAVGRWGNYFNQELFGLPTDLPWGLEISAGNQAIPVGLPAGTLFHPTFMYESLWSLAGALILLWLDRKYELRWGKLFGLYLVYYSIGRIWIENLRIDPSDVYFGIRTNVWSAIFGVIIGLAIIYVQKRRHPGIETDVYLAGRKPLAMQDSTKAIEIDSKDRKAPAKGEAE